MLSTSWFIPIFKNLERLLVRSSIFLGSLSALKPTIGVSGRRVLLSVRLSFRRCTTLICKMHTQFSNKWITPSLIEQTLGLLHRKARQAYTHTVLCGWHRKIYFPTSTTHARTFIFSWKPQKNGPKRHTPNSTTGAMCLWLRLRLLQVHLCGGNLSMREKKVDLRIVTFNESSVKEYDHSGCNPIVNRGGAPPLLSKTRARILSPSLTPAVSVAIMPFCANRQTIN